MKNMYQMVIDKQKEEMASKSRYFHEAAEVEGDYWMIRVFEALADSYDDFASELFTLWDDIEYDSNTKKEK